jgi:hypothetical protein
MEECLTVNDMDPPGVSHCPRSGQLIPDQRNADRLLDSSFHNGEIQFKGRLVRA